MSLPQRLAGRVAVITGAGGGLGRAYARTLAAAGAAVVVNDRGGAVDGNGSGSAVANAVVAEIKAAGGLAIADASDIGVWAEAGVLIGRAIDAFGALDILVNNAGILRPRTLVGMTEEEMASVLRVHLLGTAATTHFAAIHWRDRFKADGKTGGRLINTTSGSGLFGHGQANYAAAKAGIAALTAVAAEELARYGVIATAIAPTAVTRMSVGIAPENFSVEHVAQLVCWLAGTTDRGISGQVFQVGGGHISVVERCHVGISIDQAHGWQLDELDQAIPGLIAQAAAHPDVMGYRPGQARSPLLPMVTLPGDNSSSRGK